MHKLTGSHERRGERIKENIKGTISMHLYLHTGSCTHRAVAVCICGTGKTVRSCLLDVIPCLEFIKKKEEEEGGGVRREEERKKNPSKSRRDQGA